jgi:predicted dehydrogenase
MCTSYFENQGKVRIGIIGCGRTGNWHLEAYRKNHEAQVVSYVDIDLEKTKLCSISLEEATYTSHKDLIAQGNINGVSLCTVPSMHHNIVLDLLEANINVLCEKPLALSAEQCEEMINMAKEKELVLLTALKFRFFEEVIRAKELLNTQKFGEILNFKIAFESQMNMEGSWYLNKDISGGGVLMDNGPHAFDLIRYLFGDIKTVSARLSDFEKDKEIECTAQIDCKLTNGTTGNVYLSWLYSSPSETYLEIFAEYGCLALDPMGINYKINSSPDWKRINNQITIKQAFENQIDHFINSIESIPSITFPEDGLIAQRTIEEAYNTAEYF